MKIGGILKIAEVESRFDGDGAITSFIQFCEKSGFSLKWKDLKKEYFYLFDFKKTSKFNKKKVMEVTLKPCLYKKRWIELFSTCKMAKNEDYNFFMSIKFEHIEKLCIDFFQV